MFSKKQTKQKQQQQQKQNKKKTVYKKMKLLALCCQIENLPSLTKGCKIWQNLAKQIFLRNVLQLVFREIFTKSVKICLFGGLNTCHHLAIS